MFLLPCDVRLFLDKMDVCIASISPPLRENRRTRVNGPTVETQKCSQFEMIVHIYNLKSHWFHKAIYSGFLFELSHLNGPTFTQLLKISWLLISSSHGLLMSVLLNSPSRKGLKRKNYTIGHSHSCILSVHHDWSHPSAINEPEVSQNKENMATATTCDKDTSGRVQKWSPLLRLHRRSPFPLHLQRRILRHQIKEATRHMGRLSFKVSKSYIPKNRHIRSRWTQYHSPDELWLSREDTIWRDRNMQGRKWREEERERASKAQTLHIFSLKYIK